MFDSPSSDEKKTLVEKTARIVSEFGVYGETVMLDLDPKQYNFLKSPKDPYHAIYKRKLSQYLSQEPTTHLDTATTDIIRAPPYEADEFDLDDLLSAPIFIHDFIQLRPPEGVEGKKFNTMKLTAQFRAWYGDGFLAALKQKADPRLKFTKPTNRKFTAFTQFFVEFSQVLMPPKDLEDKLSKSDAFMSAVLDGFFRRLEWDASQEAIWAQQGPRAIVDWHDSVYKDFANGTGMSPCPKRQKLLVPEDQFLARNPGPLTIKVAVPNVIDIQVVSLSESVGRVKEKIAAEMHITLDKHKLSGKAGFLEDGKSLAYYNIGAGEILTLSL